MDSVDRIRDRAPATLLALERCVSTRDFENLAANRNDVWRARAFYEPTTGARRDLVRIVVVPAGGGDLSVPSRRSIEKHLAAHALPAVQVVVDPFESRPVAIDVALRIDLEAFDPLDVTAAVREALIRRFRLERRDIAEPLFLGEVYHAVETVSGVADSRCRFREDETALRLDAHGDGEVLHLTDDPEDLHIAFEGYEP
jgi:hypothetical protein